MRWIVLALLWMVSYELSAKPAMLYIHNGPESSFDHRYDFHWEVLRTALDLTSPTYGPYEMRPSVFMTETRQLSELLRADGKITVMFRGTTEELEHKLLPVRIPVDRDLSGYFVLLIHADQQTALSQVRSLDDLKKFSMGMAIDWLDNRVYQHNGFKVINGNNYDGLFLMTLRKRFDALPRSAVEVLDEWSKRKSSMPQLVIEKNLLIHYRWPMYFWFSRTEEGQKLAARVYQGMEMMLNDGRYDQLFKKYFQDVIDQLRLKERHLFELENPLLPKDTPIHDRRIWFRLHEP